MGDESMMLWCIIVRCGIIVVVEVKGMEWKGFVLRGIWLVWWVDR